MDFTICVALSKTTPSVFLVFRRNERSSDSGVCGSSSPFVSSVSGPCKPLLSGGYRSPTSNCSVGGNVVLDFGNFEVRLESCESFFGVNHLEGSPHCAGNELCRTDAHKSTPSNVRWGQRKLRRILICIERCVLDVIHNKKQKRTRSSSVGSGHHEVADGVNHGGVTGSYIDIGDYEWVCEYCCATFWYGERVKRDSNFLRPYYHRGCGGRKVVCKWRHEPPADIKEVFKNKVFQENIRAYNQMFAMTSFGACIDNYVNRRRGPYVFKISGQIYHWIGFLCPKLGNPPRLRRNDIRREYLSGVHDAISRGDREGSQVGGHILPRTFTGGPRYMYSHYPDAFVICRVLVLYTIEFQKHGLPHCHTLVWVDLKDKIQNAFEVDQYISTELPDLATDPEGYRVVSEMMDHGPCGLLHYDAVCMKKGKYGKNFLKKFIAHTFFVADGYNRQLCLAFHDHINVEYYGWSMLIKYLFKYILKGTDKIAAKIIRQVGDPPADTNNGSIQIDEIQNYIDGRLICPHEACWRILKDHQPLTLIVNDEEKMKMTLIEWLEYNKFNGDDLHLTYIDFTKEFVWYSDTKSWRRRQRRNLGLIGRLANVHPTSGELFFLRMLLCHQKGCKTFDAIRTVNKRLYLMFRAAYEALGLLGDDKELWKSFWQRMSNDVPRTVSNSLHIQDLYMNDPELEGSVLYEVEDAHKQYAFRRKTVLVFASSGIASLLLPAGHTAHSRFKLPLDLTDQSLCNIKKNTNAASLLAETSLIIWDESLMNDRRCFEALEKTLRDALEKTLRDTLDAPEKLFSGKPIVLGGDFQQTLSVKKGASKPEIVFASIAASELWPHFKVCKLTENMCLLQIGLNKYEKTRAANFASWLLELGDGKTVTVKENSDDDSSWITVPEEFCIPDDNNGLKNLIGFIYDEITLQHPTAANLQQKAIVCPKNTTADEINETVLEMLHGKIMVYTSLDEAIPVGSDRGEVKLLYPHEYLNTLEFSGFPSHRLELKVGAPIMLLQNMNLQGGMCNGTRMIIKKLSSRLIEANVITRNKVGERIYIPRIVLTTKEPHMSFTFKRKQFLVKLGNMTVNCILNLKPRAKKLLEAKVYRKWTNRSPPKTAPTDYCCILIDRERKNKNNMLFNKVLLKHQAPILPDQWTKWLQKLTEKSLKKMEQPVIFAISSCKANIYEGIQLSGTPATHYYFNPKILGLEELQEQ
uniref:ATP-dependent DNA helicase n=1 Tax=Tanacetum cinerariifolium TaxID=118510 RepID=A0A6L2NGG2_TANCI|nr:DNA helicase [Tanacetum cinerariifolium]